MILRYLITAFLSVPAFAGSFSFTAVTSGLQPTYNRPLMNVGAVTTVFTGLSPNAPAVPYSATTLNILNPVGTPTANYSFSSVGTSPVNWDNALFLYSGSFTPLNPLNNRVIGMTGYQHVNQGTSAFNIVLATGTYVLVTTGVFGGAVNPVDSGIAANSINGLGTITASTPEPGPFVMIGIGLVMIGAKRFKRNSTT